MKRIENPNNNEWVTKYNNLMEKSFSHPEIYGDRKLGIHHIIPRSIAPDLTNDPDNQVLLPFQEHMDAHYYLWKSDPKWARQLWFGCVYGRKNGLWDLPGGDTEYEQLKKDLRRDNNEDN